MRTLIATAKGLSEEKAPKVEDIKTQVEAAIARFNLQKEAEIKRQNATVKDPAKKQTFIPVKVNWRLGGVSAEGPYYATIMQDVLSQYGVKSSVRPGLDPQKKITEQEAATIMQALVNTLIAKGTAAMLNVGESLANQHAVTVQWSPTAGTNRKGRFLVNNLIAKGGTSESTLGEFASGMLRDNEQSTGGSALYRTYRPVISLVAPVIFTEQP